MFTNVFHDKGKTLSKRKQKFFLVTIQFNFKQDNKFHLVDCIVTSAFNLTWRNYIHVTLPFIIKKASTSVNCIVCSSLFRSFERAVSLFCFSAGSKYFNKDKLDPFESLGCKHYIFLINHILFEGWKNFTVNQFDNI